MITPDRNVVELDSTVIITDNDPGFNTALMWPSKAHGC